jgi:glycogen operon protein
LILTGSSEAFGASVVDGGVNFAVYAPEASRLELCLYDAPGREFARHDLPAQTAGVWHGFVPGIGVGQAYGYRAHGSYAPEAGLRFNPHKLLLDPWTRALSGEFRWDDAVFDFDRRESHDRWSMNLLDSAPYVPKSVVTVPRRGAVTHRLVPPGDSVIYELNVRGFSMRHPALEESHRGRIGALGEVPVIDYLKALGVTSVELMPMHALIDEEFLTRRGLRNFWGYNPLAFSVPEPRLLGADGISGLTRAIDALHDAGIEVLLDVVYNHTAEGGSHGPSLCFRGLANAVWYRLAADSPGVYINDTGCGNTINTGHPVVRRLIVDSLAYWAREVGIDGFRFDLATILGRSPDGFSPTHPLFAEIRAAPELADVKLIAEPWDLGPGGYQLGGFPGNWAEWNDQFRDTVRRFWRQDPGVAPDFARRVHGSADIFEHGGRGPAASINFIASHDGFTTADLVSFDARHNDANGEQNRDGHEHNFSTNHGVEGDTTDTIVNAARRRHRLNLLATLLLSQGTPMLLAGDEFGNSQAGNNNAYAQDNEIGWLDWSALDRDPAFFSEVAALVQLRRELPLLRQRRFRHGDHSAATGRADIEWFGGDGLPIDGEHWPSIGVLGVLLSRPDKAADNYYGEGLAVSILYNVLDEAYEFSLPAIDREGSWHCRYSSAGILAQSGTSTLLPAFSIACLEFRPQ